MRFGGRLRWIGDDTDRTTWRDVVVILRCTGPHSAIARAGREEEAMWGLGEQLLAQIADLMHISVWQNTVDGHKGRRRPKPIPRPGVTNESSLSGSTSEEHIGEATTLAELNTLLEDWFADPNPAPDPAPEPVVDKRHAAIAAYRAGDGTYRQLAARFGVSATTIGRWVRAAEPIPA